MFRSFSFLGMCILSLALMSTRAGAAELTVSTPGEAAAGLGGVWIVIGADDPDLLIDLAKAADGRALIQGLCLDESRRLPLREALAASGLLPLVDVRSVSDLGHLPYVSHVASLIVVNEAALKGRRVDPAELRRVLAFDRPLVTGTAGKWRVTREAVPADVGEWSHAIHGPDRIPVSGDARVGPWVDGVRWLAAGAEAKHSYDNAGLRLAGGRLFAFWGTADRKKPIALVAHDAASGLRLWSQPVHWAPRGWANEFYRAAHTLVANDRYVYCYPNEKGHLTAFDARTGRVARVFDHTASLLPDEKLDAKGRVVQAPGLGDAAVLLFDGKILQTYQRDIWLMSEDDGKIIWHYEDAEGWIASACLGDDGRVYAMVMGSDSQKRSAFPKVSGPRELKALVCIDPASGKQVWRTAMTDVRASAINGPQNGFLPILVTDPKQKGHGPHEMRMYNARNGEKLWHQEIKAYRGYAFQMGDQTVFQAAWSKMAYLDPRTGKQTSEHAYHIHGGGCSYEVFTSRFLVRGLTLHPLDDIGRTYANIGVRPNCQLPVIPAYGALYSSLSNCGCAWYLPTGMASVAQHHEQPNLPDASRTDRAAGLVLKGALSDRALRGPIVESWPWTVDAVGGAKETRWSGVPEAFRTAVEERHGKLGRHKSPWYGQSVEDVSAGELVLHTDAHRHSIVARRQGEVVWTAVLNGRIGTKPIVVGDTVYAACHDGRVYALELGTGQVRWRVLVAPNEQQLVAFGQLESLWPCAGLVEHEGQLLTVAGRLSTFDTGLFAASIDPQSGRLRWRVRLAAEPVEFATPESTRRGEGFGVRRGGHVGQPFSRAWLSLNSPPFITDGKLHVIGMLAVDLQRPVDQVFTVSKEAVK